MATINIGGMEMELTTERQRRIVEAIAETQRLIDKEMRYSENLQKQDYLEQNRAHLAKLIAMLNG